MVLLIHRAKLRDFISHSDTEVLFPYGVTTIIGDNGSGKTSIIDAIIVAFGDKDDIRIRGRKVNLVRHGKPYASVSIEFSIGNKRYSIERVITRSGSDERRLYEYIDGNKKLLASGARVYSELHRIMGVKPKTINTIAILRQGRLQELISLLGSSKTVKKKELIDELLDLHKYREAYEKIKDILTYSIETPDKTVLRVSPTRRDVDNLGRLVESSKNKLASLEEEYKKLEEEITGIEKECSAVTEKLSTLGEKITSLRSRRDELLRKIDVVREKKQRLEELIEEKSLREKELEKLLGEERLLREKAVLMEKYVRLHEVIESIDSILKEIRILDMEKKEYTELYSRVKRFRELEELGVRERFEEYNSLRDEKTRLEARKKEIKKAIEKYSRETSSIRREIEAIDNEINGLLKEIGSETLESIESRIRDLVREKSLLEARMDSLEEVIESLEKAGAECPVCKRPLTREHREKLLQEARSELEKVCSRLEELSSKLSSLESHRDRVRELYSRVERLRARRETLVENLRRYEGLLRETESMYKNVSSRLEEVVSKIDGYERENIVELGKEYESLARILGDKAKTSLEDIEEEIKRINESIEELSSRLDSYYEVLARELGLSRDVLMEKFSSIREKLSIAKDKYDKLVNTLNEVTRRIEHVRGKLSTIEREISVIERELAGIDIEGLEAMLRDIEVELNKLEEEYRGLDNRRVELETLLRVRKERFEEVSREISLYRGFIERARRIHEVLSIACYLRENVFNVDKAPEALRSRALRVIEEEASRILSEFELDYTVIGITGDIDIIASSPYASRSFQELSSGEQVAVALAIILALHKIVGKGRLGVVVLDEPTIHLDTERRRKLIEIIKSFRGGHIIPQLVVVTHDREVVNAADTVYLVRKKPNGVSEVTTPS